MASKNARRSAPVAAWIDCGERSGGEGTGRDDGRAPFGGRQPGHLAALDADQRMRAERRRHGFRKSVAVNRQRAARGKLMPVAHRHHERARAPHLGVKQPDGVGFGIVGAKRIGADQLREILGLVRRRHCRRPHLVEHDGDARLGELPSCLGTRESAADDVNGIGLRLHWRDMARRPRGRQVPAQPELFRRGQDH